MRYFGIALFDDRTVKFKRRSNNRTSLLTPMCELSTPCAVSELDHWLDHREENK